LSVEYHAIVTRGLLPQVDAPDLVADRSGTFSDLSLAEYLRRAKMVVDTINNALESIDPQHVRLHVCWGNMEVANPRHAHEYKCFARDPLPDGMKLVAGVIDSTTNYVEHPEVVADRLEPVAAAVGDPSRIIAGTDRGFASLAGYTRWHRRSSRRSCARCAWAQTSWLRASFRHIGLREVVSLCSAAASSREDEDRRLRKLLAEGIFNNAPLIT